jgi:hypothetical protein
LYSREKDWISSEIGFYSNFAAENNYLSQLIIPEKQCSWLA